MHRQLSAIADWRQSSTGSFEEFLVPRCRSATWICMCGHTRDPIIYSEFYRNPFRGFGAPGGQNLAFRITLASRFYNSLYYRTSRDNLHTIAITAPITTKFCTVIKNTKYSSWVVPTREKPTKMADDRHLEKSKNCHISAAVWAISTKCGTQTQFDPLERPNRYKFEISKIQDGVGRHLEKIKIGHISGTVWSIFARFGTMTHIVPRNRTGSWNFQLSKIQDGGRPPSSKIEKSLYLSRGSSDFDKIWQADAVRPSCASQPLKIWNFQNPGWRRPPSWKIENRPYLWNGSTDLREIFYDDPYWASEWDRKLKFPTFKNPRWRTAAIFKNRKIAISQPRFERFRQNLASRRGSTLLCVSTVKNLKFPKSKMAVDKSKIGIISGTVRSIFAKFGTMTHVGPPNRTGS